MAYNNALRKFLSDNGIDEAQQTAQMPPQEGALDPQAVAFTRAAMNSLYDPVSKTFRSGGAMLGPDGQITEFAQAPRPEQTKPKGVKLMGYDPSSGSVADLGMAQDTMESPSSQPDVSRPQLELAGVGKGYYSKDGKYLLVDGGRTKIMLGYNQRVTEKGQDRQRDIRKDEAEIAYRETMNQKAQADMNAPAGLPSAPAGYRWTSDGSRLEPIPGGPAAEGKASTEDEKKAAGYAIRMDLALKQMEELGKLEPAAVKPQIGSTIASGIPLVGAPLANKLNSSVRRRIEASQLDALDAALTLATGAAYTKEQLQGLSKSYFPQIGDEPPDIQDKQNRLESIIQTARIRAGRAAPTIDQAVSAQQARVAAGRPPDANFNLVKEAQDAIKRGAPRAAVVQRLEAQGISNHGL